MREMIFNELSLAPTKWNERAAASALSDLANGMIILVSSIGCNKMLRLSREITDIVIAGGFSLYQILILMVRNSELASREEAAFWLSLATRAPLLFELPDEVKNRFLGCEGTMTAMSNSDTLVLCAVHASVAISLPTSMIWDNDQLTVRFKELLPDGNEVEVNETIDNLSGVKQAAAICLRHVTNKFSQLTSTTFWENRKVVFPALHFGLDVEKNILSIGGSQFETIMGCLDDLNSSIIEWQNCDEEVPKWRRLVTPESTTVNQNKKLRDCRNFPDHNGVTRYCEWHARYGGSGRIHFCFEEVNRGVVIGYIGNHLPL